MKYSTLVLLLSATLLLFSSCEKGTEGPAPEVISFTPEKGVRSNTVFIYGKNMGNDSTGAVVKFGDKAAKILFHTDTTLTVEVPAGVITAPISITNNGSTIQTSKPFTILKGYWTLKKDLFHPNVLVRYSGITFTYSNLGYYGFGYDGGTTWGDLYSYDPVTNTVKQLATCPSALEGAAVLLIGAKVYTVAGRSARDPNNTGREVWCYDISNNTWTQKGNFPGSSRYLNTGFVVNGKGYVGAGQSISYPQTDTNDWWEYNAANDTWTKKADIPTKLFVQTPGFVINDKIYFGASSYGYNNDWYSYDPLLDKWTKLKDSPASGGFGAAGVVLNNSGYIMGNSFPLMWQYDVASDSWVEHGFVNGLHAGSSININGKLYYIAGRFGEAQVWEYVPE